jgi:hypothetical protein
MQSAAEIVKIVPELAKRSGRKPAKSKTPKKVKKTYMARPLVLCTLPHSDPGDSTGWSRYCESENVYLVIQPGWNRIARRSYGYPYGSIPRLLLIWMVTEAQFRKADRRLSLEEKRTLTAGRSLAEFMRKVGLNPDNGADRRSDLWRLRDQMRRLFEATISFQRSTLEGKILHEESRSMRITTRAEYWWDTGSPRQSAFWDSRIHLTQEFFDEITATVIPVNFEALREFKNSPLALDLYFFAAYQAFHANRLAAPQIVTWKELKEQLGADYRSDRPDKFRQKVKAMVRRLSKLGFHGKLQIEYRRGFGIAFLPGTPLPVAPESSHLQQERPVSIGLE